MGSWPVVANDDVEEMAVRSKVDASAKLIIFVLLSISFIFWW